MSESICCTLGGGHCLAIRIGTDMEEVTVYDIGGVYNLDAERLLRAVTESIDSNTVLVFQLVDDPRVKQEEEPYLHLHSLRAAGSGPACSSTDTPAGFIPGDAASTQLDDGIDVELGANVDDVDDDEALRFLDLDDDGNADAEAQPLVRRRITCKRPLSEEEARFDEFALLPAARLVAVLRQEVSVTKYRAAVLERGCADFPCPLCPFRSFARRDRLVEPAVLPHAQYHRCATPKKLSRQGRRDHA